MRKLIMAGAASLVLAASAQAQVGQPLPPAELEGFTQTEATSFDEFTGRLVLLEFFAYW